MCEAGVCVITGLGKGDDGNWHLGFRCKQWQVIVGEVECPVRPVSNVELTLTTRTKCSVDQGVSSLAVYVSFKLISWLFFAVGTHTVDVQGCSVTLERTHVHLFFFFFFFNKASLQAVIGVREGEREGETRCLLSFPLTVFGSHLPFSPPSFLLPSFLPPLVRMWCLILFNVASCATAALRHLDKSEVGNKDGDEESGSGGMTECAEAVEEELRETD